MKCITPIIVLGIVLALTGCWTITVKHQVEPIYITMNVNVKVEKQLDEFFDFEDEVQKGSGSTKSIPHDKTPKQ
jgi:hypothetical protein